MSDEFIIKKAAKKKTGCSLDFSRKAKLARLDVLEHRYNRYCDALCSNATDSRDLEYMRADIKVAKKSLL
jgi:hypothetical protein